MGVRGINNQAPGSWVLKYKLLEDRWVAEPVIRAKGFSSSEKSDICDNSYVLCVVMYQGSHQALPHFTEDKSSFIPSSPTSKEPLLLACC